MKTITEQLDLVKSAIRHVMHKDVSYEFNIMSGV